ncbi:Phage-related minor tail protein [Achromobacter xylosoxidans]|uniref:tape measure protein n=1 Tax=Alcaligenes xylosoxydans xylosoxydans TaxID=85698 RepID=UPI0006C6573F|nr:tape measure protein [Achromobacter xylosoxidans]CUK19067.1 Phage-related minor tail protein [Achromobacter xylosoxidans]
MTTVRELVTLLRYQVDEAGLKKYEDAYQDAQEAMRKASAKTVQSMRQALTGAVFKPGAWSVGAGRATGGVPAPTLSRPAQPGLPLPVRVPATGAAGPGVAAAFPVNVAETRARIGQVQAAYGTLLARARAGLHVVREVGIGTWEGIRLGIQDARQAQERMTRSQWQGTRAVKEQAGAFAGLRGIIGAVLGVSIVKRIFGDIDAWGQMEARMKQATSSAQEYAEVDQELARVSRLTYKSYSSSAELFVRTRRTMADLGKTTQDTIDVTEGLSLGMALSSTKAQDQESVISSVTKAIMQNKLGMEEYSTLMRAAPRLQVALADGLGITTDKLLEQVKAGKLTTDTFLPALQSQLAKMRVEAQDMPVTIADAMTVWNDAFQRFFGKTLTFGRTAVLGVTQSIEFLADNIATVIKLLAISGSAWGLVKLRGWLRLASFQSGGLVRSLVAATRAAIGLDSAMALRRGPAGAARMLAYWNRTLAPMLRMAAVLATIYLLVDDIGVWFRGGDSVFGDLIGPVEDWRNEIEAVKAVLVQVKDFLGGTGQALGPWAKKWGTIAVMAYGLWRILSPVRGLIMFLATKAVPSLWKAFAMTPIGRVVAVITAALWLIWSNWDRVVKFFVDSWDGIRNAAKGTFMEPVIEYIEAIWAFWEGIFEGVVAAFTGDWDGAIKHWHNAFSGLWKYFDQIGDRMVAKIKDIGNAITEWISKKWDEATEKIESFLPEWMRDKSMAESGRRGNAWLRENMPWLSPIMGDTYLKPDPAATVRAGVVGSGPVTVQNHAEVTINAPGADPNAIAGATRRGMEATQQRSADAMARFFQFPTGVEAPR